MKDPEDVSKLIGLKRYETPGEEYFARFTADFKERQRSELLRQSSFSLFRERFAMWYQQAGSGAWMVPTGMAAVVAGGVALIAFQEQPADLPVNGIADLDQSLDVSLPPFPESTDEVIELRIPSPSQLPVEPAPSFDEGFLPTGANGPLIEL